jgi:hypothetical protein
MYDEHRLVQMHIIGPCCKLLPPVTNLGSVDAAMVERMASVHSDN